MLIEAEVAVLVVDLRAGEMASNASVGTGFKCPPPMKATSNGAFQGDDPLHFALPLAILQICLVLVVTRVLALLLRPLKQPRVIAEIIVSFFLSFLKPNRSAVTALP